VEEIRLSIGQTSAPVFYCQVLTLMCLVFCDVFTTLGPKSSLDKFKSKLEENGTLKEAACKGSQPDDDKEARPLNRSVRWTHHGIGLPGSEYAGSQANDGRMPFRRSYSSQQG